MLCGATGAEKEMTEEVKELCHQMRPHLEDKLGRSLQHFEPVSFREQVVAGRNYFVKVKVHPEGQEFVHLRIYHDLQRNVSLTSFKEGKAHHEPLEYF